MKRFGTMFVLIVALGLVTASSALAATPNPYKVIGAPTNTTWTGIAPANTSGTGLPSSSKAWDVRKPSDVRRPSDVRQGARGWSSTWTGIGARSWSDGARPS